MFKPPKQVPCPQCRTPVTWSSASPHRPFCSERCRLIDLGQWANEAYRIPCKDEAPTIDDMLN
ncbi:hypothetical protein HNQ59_000639 [Chitinivorax tropicus]|uniref:DNA gyrase inhibitor YacG n=1 Tax=Chitinivorax tropicus TaxID=714531 RepID=A0A840MIN4_9PROT|nr:DNA gyrase inhibitor YacG [Chitinivorax tropicus]MBB5017375.1 hypothetical protein [Chitinivorax tropicus]